MPGQSSRSGGLGLGGTSRTRNLVSRRVYLEAAQALCREKPWHGWLRARKIPPGSYSYQRMSTTRFLCDANPTVDAPEKQTPLTNTYTKGKFRQSFWSMNNWSQVAKG